MDAKPAFLGPNCLGALALERSIEGDRGRLTLERTEAEALAEFIAADLKRLLPGVDALDGVFAAALFDPAELLRPGWPVHQALDELAARAPGRTGGRVIAFGAESGRMPVSALQPEPGLAQGLLRLLPFLLRGEAAAVRAIGESMEERLLDAGMAQPRTALEAQQRFGFDLEHARFLSIHDLCAMTALQYQHAGLAPVWQLLEAALLSPDREEWIDVEGEPLAWCLEGRVRIAEADRSLSLRVRQFCVVLGAHAIAVEAVPIAPGQDPRTTLREPRNERG